MAKKLLFLFFIFISIFKSISQEVSPCATITTDEVRAQMLAIDREARLGMKTRGSWLYIPIQFHIVGTNEGTGYFLTEKVFELLCNLNEQFEPLKVRYFIYGEFNYIPNSSYYDHDFSTGYDMMMNHNVNGTVNTYIVGNPAGACGYAYYPGSGPNGGGIALRQSCSGPGNSTFAHELGHFFSLPHTFDQWQFNPEYVNGTNCQNAGDYFCDTRADRLDYRWNCPYNLQLTDPNNDYYDPDGSNFMSYSIEPCGTRFSEEQQSAMIYSMTYDYGGALIKHPQPNLNQVTSNVELVSPAGEAYVKTKSMAFTWKSVPNAAYYHFLLHRKNIPGNSRVEVFTTDTFFVVNDLKEKFSYEWKVMGFHPNSTCGPVSKSFFTTDAGLGIQNAMATSAMPVFPNPVKPGEPIYASHGMDPGNINVSVYNLHGTKLMDFTIQSGSNVLKVDLPGLTQGLYFMEMGNHTGKKSFGKFMVLGN